MFILCLTPNILNGFHVSSYVFLSQMPANYYCVMPDLLAHGWTHDEIRNISTPGGLTRNGTCTVLDWDYARFANMNYVDALAWTTGVASRPGERTCLGVPGFQMHYEQPAGYSIVPEWDLICERTAYRSTVQVALSIGKFFGASTFGILSDKYGRKSSFTIAAILYIVSGVLTTFSPVYALLLLGRIGLGASASGVFYPPFALRELRMEIVWRRYFITFFWYSIAVTENVGVRHRSWMSIAFNFSYPIGMLILAAAAYYIKPWRDLSLALTIPSFLLIIHL